MVHMVPCGSLVLARWNLVTSAHDRARSNPIHWMSNVTTALNFLRSKSIKLVNINVPDIVDGNPTVILGLIWSIILYFQVEKLASGLTSRQTPMEPSPALNSSPAALSPQREETLIHAGQKKSAETTLLHWVQEKTEDLGFVIRDFSTSWRSGLAFVAIINALRPGLLDLAELKQRSDTENLEMVFRVAEQELKIPRLLEAQDIAVSNPDEKSIITYISQFLQYSKEHAAAEDTKKQTESPCLVSSDVLCAEPAQVGEHTVSKADVKRDFEESKRKIEACIEGAMQFLEDRGSPEELIVKHQETIRSFDSGIIEHFLEATDKIKMILTPQKKRIIEEMRAELCRNWEKVQSLVDAHLHRMKFEVEQNKFNAALQESEIHQGMDSSHVQSLLTGDQVGSDVLCAEPAQVGEHTVSEADVKRDFEESKRKIEACIEGAMQFLEDRGSPEELIVKHQETIRSFDSGIIEHFLEATDKIKMILTPQKKRIVEEMRAELCRNWEKVQSLVDAHLHRMKFEVEQNKFNAALQESEIHQGMDSSHGQSLLAGDQVGSDVLCAEPAQVGEHTVSEADVKRDFEESKRKIEACIEGAMQFLEDRGSPEKLIVKHQETIRSFDSGIIEHFLEATDKIKMILTPQKKRIIEEMRAELCRNWEKVQSLVDAHLHRMKFEVEQNKFNAALQESEIHQGMDSSHRQSLLAGDQVGSDVLCAEPAQVGEHTVSEADVKRDFEESKRKIEACIEGAMQFLEDRGSPEKLIVKHQETIRSFDSGIIEHFLEATDKIKMILTPQKKRIIEEMRAELCRNWEKVQSLVDAHLHRMKFEVEQNKFNASLQESEIHQGMDSSHGQSLLAGHQMFFSKGSSLTRAQQHLAAMRELCDGNVDAEIKATLQSCEDRKTDLEQRLIKCFSWFQDPVSSPQTGELKSECQSEVDLTEAATRKAPSGWTKRRTEQADDPGGENSAQPVTKVGQASTQLGAAEPNRNILVDIEASEIPGPWTEWIRIDDLGRESQTQSVQETQSRKLQGDWLQRGDCQQSVTHCLTDGEPPATVKGERSGQRYSMSQRGDTEAPSLNFTQLQMQSSSGEDQVPAQAMGSHTDLVAISSRSQGLAEDSGQLAKYLLMGKCEMEMFPNVDITHLGEDPLSGQGQGEATHRDGSAFPSKQHQGRLQTGDSLAQSQKEKTGPKALDTARTEKHAQATLMALSKEQQAAHRGTKAIAEFSKGFLTEQLSLTGRDQGEDIPACVEVSLSEEEQLDKPTAQATVEWPVAVQDQSDVSDTQESLFGRKQGESLTLCDKDSLIGADQTDPCAMKSSVNLNGAIQRGQEQTGEYHIEGNQTLMRELPTHDNPEFVFDQEQTITAATESTVQLPKEYSSGIDQAYGLLEDGSQKSPTVSVSERELTGNQSRQDPTQLSTSSPVRTDRCDHPTMAGSGQVSELALSGDIKVCDLPGEDSGQLPPDSVSEEGTDADLTAEDFAQSGKECVMEKELNILESEKISHSGTELHSGKVQILGLPGVGSPKCQREREHVDRTTTGSSAPLMTMSLSGQFQADATVMEDPAAVSGKDLSERDKADGLVSDVSPGAVTEPLPGKKQIENAITQDVVRLVRASEGQHEEIRESMTSGNWGDDLTLSVEEILIRADQTDPCRMKDSVNWEGSIQGEHELTGGCWGKVSAPPKIGAMAVQDEAYGFPSDDTDRLPISFSSVSRSVSE
ncbi:uncharacterized protein LOC132818232 [Hemiscyllium ocellatum]|uniref:uncharacterized protein LOC132818232 n=1 Tax=Hemiscyllium ocellatum TaxID=170820 RepID=UPI002966B608|nr:uncharacterized protein LOC132818232 [Hemiscyllium ocellatum]